MKYLMLTLFLVATSAAISQSNKEMYIEQFKKQIKAYPGQALGFSARNIYHVYDITIPADAEIEETEYAYVISKVEVTLAASNTVFDITKQTITYKLTVFKEFKGSYTVARKDISNIKVVWQKKEETREFRDALKELSNLGDTDLEELYGSEDAFPAEWKTASE